MLAHCVRFLDPFAGILGLDGAILMAFVLAFPANEIVLPLAMMAYLCGGALAQPESTQALGALFAPERLDVADGAEHHPLFPDALALLDHSADHCARNAQRKMDVDRGAAAHGVRHGRMRAHDVPCPHAAPGVNGFPRSAYLLRGRLAGMRAAGKACKTLPCGARSGGFGARLRPGANAMPECCGCAFRKPFHWAKNRPHKYVEAVQPVKKPQERARG